MSKRKAIPEPELFIKDGEPQDLCGRLDRLNGVIRRLNKNPHVFCDEAKKLKLARYCLINTILRAGCAVMTRSDGTVYAVSA